MQIIIPAAIKKILFFLGMFYILAILFLLLRPVWFPTTPTPTPGLPQDEQAAVDAVSSFYTLDYTADPDLWAVQMCILSTDLGCQAIRQYFAPVVQSVIQTNTIQTGCVVTPLRLVAVNENSRIWELQVVLDHPWPGLENPSEHVIVEVAEEDGIWLMNRILFDQEAEYLPTPIPGQER